MEGTQIAASALQRTPAVIAAVKVLLWQKSVRSTALRTHHLEESSMGNCARLSFKRYRPLARYSPSSTSLLSLL